MVATRRACASAAWLRSQVSRSGSPESNALASWWAGQWLRRRHADLGRTAAAVALPLLVSFSLAPVVHLNYEAWYLTVFVLSAGLLVSAPTRPRVPAMAA